MRSYTVTGLAEGERAEAVRRALRGHYGNGVTVEVDLEAGVVRVDGSADPQVVNLLIEGAGCTVTAVGDWPAGALANPSPP